jgi:anhydro-N-acetylmuramic acid kinase
VEIVTHFLLPFSGTSADGISCVLSEISHSFLNEDGTKRSEHEPKIHIKELAFDTLPWSDKNRETIFRLFKAHDLSIAEVCEANFRLGEETAKVVLHTIARAGLKPEQVHLIGSHGQTVWHQVDDQTKNVTSTLQIGEPACIAELTGITTIADFRVADVAAGGQGAPLTSTLDWLLLRQPSTSQRWRALQNIGGIGNVTLLPPVGFSGSLSAVAFDTGPGNVLMDWFIQKKSNGALLFDEDGKFARSGSVNVELLSKLLQHPYFERKPPKTTGRELFSANVRIFVVLKGRQSQKSQRLYSAAVG